MSRTLPALLILVSLPAGSVEAGSSFLYQPAYSVDHYLRLPATPYTPQPGDLFFAMTETWVMRLGHRLAGAADPHHSGIVFARPDGSLAVLEAGPFNTLYVSGWDVLGHLQAYERTERVWIRRRRIPLTPEQSQRLTAFCTAQIGKPFASVRVLAQLTPFRTRMPWGMECRGEPKGDRHRWFCAELVVEALVAACLLDAQTARPSATYPRDLFFDRSPNAWLNRYLNLSDQWLPPAQWTSAPYGSSATPPRRVYWSPCRTE